MKIIFGAELLQYLQQQTGNWPYRATV